MTYDWSKTSVGTDGSADTGHFATALSEYREKFNDSRPTIELPAAALSWVLNRAQELKEAK